MQGILGAAPDSLLVLITSLAFLLYIVALAVPGIYSSISTDKVKAELEKYLPSVDDTATLFGLVLAAIALIPNSKEEIYKYNAALMFLSGSGLFIFLYLRFARMKIGF
jgi:hypothetical protein